MNQAKIWLGIDIDHTLVETEQFQYQAWLEVLWDTIPFSQELYSNNYCWRGSWEIAQELSQILHVDPKEFYHERTKILDAIINEEKYFKLLPWVERFFTHVHAYDIPYILITWWSRKESREKINKSALKDILRKGTEIISKDDYTYSKPNAEAYLLGKKILKNTPGGQNIEKFIAFEDTIAGMLSALDAGYDNVHIIPHIRSQSSFDIYRKDNNWFPTNVIELSSIGDYRL